MPARTLAPTPKSLSHFHTGIKKLIENKKRFPIPVIAKQPKKVPTHKPLLSDDDCPLPYANTDLLSTYILSCAWGTTTTTTPPPVQPGNVLVPTDWTSYFNADGTANLNLLMAMVKVVYNTINYATTQDLLQMTQETASAPSWCSYGYYFDPASGYILTGFPSNATTSSNPGCGGGQIGIVGGGGSSGACVWLKLVTLDDPVTVYQKLNSYKTVLGNGTTMQVSTTMAYIVPPVRHCKTLMCSVAIPSVGVGNYFTPTLGDFQSAAQFGIVNTQQVSLSPNPTFSSYLQMTLTPNVTTQTFSNDGTMVMYLGSGGDLNVYANQTITINPPALNGFDSGCGVGPSFSSACQISSVPPTYNLYTNIQNRTTTSGVTWTLGFTSSTDTTTAQGSVPIIPFLQCKDNATGTLYTNLSGCEIKTTNMISIYLVLQDWIPSGEEVAWGPYFGPQSINDLWQVVDSNGYTHIGGRSYVDNYCTCPSCSSDLSCVFCKGFEDFVVAGGCSEALEMLADLSGVPYSLIDDDLCNRLSQGLDFCPWLTGCDSC